MSDASNNPPLAPQASLRARCLAFLRSPAVLSTTFILIFFLQLFSNWSFRPDVFGHMYLAVRVFFWFGIAVGVGLLLHFIFDQITDRMARPETSHPGRHSPPALTLFRR